MNELDETTTQLPGVLEAEWDYEQIDALFEDLRNGAVVQHVQVRTASNDHREDIRTTLDHAHQLLTSGEAKAIQIRYEFDDHDWYDTLMPSPDSVRIIRTRVD